MTQKQLKSSDAGGVVTSARRGRPTKESTRLRMANLLEVARNIFVRQGYRATTMDEVAAAAGVTKRTLYAWHADKEALFRACAIMGAERFPRVQPEPGSDLRTALENYVIELHEELTREDSYGMALLFVREASDFPEMAESIERGHFDFTINPLAEFLRQHGLEEASSVEHTILFVAMALSPLHNAMLIGMPLPGPPQVAAHARRCVGVFLHGSQITQASDG